MKVQNLSAEYKIKSRITKVFSNISFELTENSVTALCGLNGSGKSTLLSLMAGIKPDSLTFKGAVHISGASIFEMPAKIRAQKISYLVQNESNIWDISVKQLIEEGRFAHHKWFENNDSKDSEVVNEAVKLLKLENFLDRSIFALSGGELQRVRIARALVQESSYILLDEPLASLDINRQKELMKILQQLSEKGKTILISIHDINTASLFCENIILMKKNRNGCLHGRTEEILTKENLKEVYDSDFMLFNHPVTGKIQVY